MLCVAMIAGCGEPPRGPFFGDEKFLRFGVQPGQEADEVRRVLEQNGQRLALRLEGKHFIAMGFSERSGAPGSVRVITLRGIVVSLDAAEANALSQGVAYRLLPAPGGLDHDADADGFEEVFVETIDGRALEGCISVYRIRDVGFVDSVGMQADALGMPLCASDLRDVDQDGRAELVATLRLESGEEPASIELPLWAEDHKFVSAPRDGRATRYLEVEAGIRRASLAAARRDADVGEAYRLGLELAAIARLSGADADTQIGLLQDAVAGLGPPDDLARRLARARERIRRGWLVASPADR